MVNVHVGILIQGREVCTDISDVMTFFKISSGQRILFYFILIFCIYIPLFLFRCLLVCKHNETTTLRANVL